MTLLAPNKPYCLFEDGKTAWLFENARQWITAHDTCQIETALQQIEEALSGGAHAAGYIAYEAASALEDLPTQAPDQALLCFGIFDAPEQLIGPQLDHFWRQKTLQAPACSSPQVRPLWDEQTYAAAMGQVKQHLAAGDIYQANITFPLDIAMSGSAEAFYARLRRNQPAAYSAFMALPDTVILSLSPERFFALKGQCIETQPMKGTAPIDAPGAAKALQADPKNRAENLMITDLLRNDLSRVAATASVQVPALFEVERLPSLYQMTSKVTATLKPGTALREVLGALFPCGSVTGAPKYSAMDIIKRIESQPRGVYCGTMGMLSPNGDMTFNVPIRTIIQNSRSLQMSVGSGIVADSDAQSEYAECLLKAEFLDAKRPDFALIETMGWAMESEGSDQAPDMPRYWPLHRARLEAAAAYFGFAPLPKGLENDLKQWLGGLGKEPQKIRLLYSRHGAMSLTASPAPPLNASSMTVRLGHLPAGTETAFLANKTTNRAAYQTAREHADANGPCDEVFLIDSDGTLSEGTYTNIFIKKSGALLTPRVTGRFLPGVLRAHLLESGAAQEADLTQRDLEDADALYAGNALRGLVPAHVVGSEANTS